jgi:hypothetical protein
MNCQDLLGGVILLVITVGLSIPLLARMHSHILRIEELIKSEVQL